MNGSTRTSASGEEQGTHLLDYLLVLYRRKWVVVFGFLVIAVLIALRTMYRPTVPVYEATSKIVIAPGQLQDVVPKAPHLQNLDLETQIEIIKTPSVLKRAIQQLDLSNAKEGTPEFKSAVSSMKNSLHTAFVGDTLIVRITATYTDPRLARDVANAVAQAYIDYDRQAHIQAGRDAVAWLTEEIADIDTRLRNAEKAFQDFKKKEGIVTLDVKQSEDASELTKLNSNYISAKAKRMELEAILERLKGDPLTAAELPADALATQGLQSLNSQLVSLRMQLAEKQRIFTDKYPAITRLKSDIEFANKRLLEGLYAQLEALRTQEKVFLNALDAKKAVALSLGAKEIEYLDLEREVNLNRGLHELLLTRMQEFSLVDNSYFSDIRILEYAELPTVPKKGKMLPTIALGVLSGLMLGIGLAFFLEYMDRSIRTPDDVSRRLGLPVLGLVPLDEEARKADLPLIIAIDENESLAAEAYRALGTNLLFSSFFEDRTPLPDLSLAPQVVMITSAKASEGKSMSVLNLGVVLAQMERKVLLVDGDLRRPVLHKAFAADRLRGLSAVFAGEMTVEDAIAETAIPNLKVLPSGPKPLNPVTTLNGSKIKEMLASLRQHYDFILLDSPPMLGYADALVLANMVDAVLLVIKAGDTGARPVGMAVRQLQQVKGNLLGVVLNSADLSRDRYYYYGYYHYGYYTEYSESDGRPKEVRRRKSEVFSGQ